MANQRQIIEENLTKMFEENNGGMDSLLGKESFGGNAGTEGDSPCAGANFYFDRETGKITYFGNIQEVPNEIRRICLEGTFRVALKSISISGRTRSYKFEIVGEPIYHEPAEASEAAKLNLKESAEWYNRVMGF